MPCKPTYVHLSLPYISCHDNLYVYIYTYIYAYISLILQVAHHLNHRITSAHRRRLVSGQKIERKRTEHVVACQVVRVALLPEAPLRHPPRARQSARGGALPGVRSTEVIILGLRHASRRQRGARVRAYTHSLRIYLSLSQVLNAVCSDDWNLCASSCIRGPES